LKAKFSNSSEIEELKQEESSFWESEENFGEDERKLRLKFIDGKIA